MSLKDTERQTENILISEKSNEQTPTDAVVKVNTSYIDNIRDKSENEELKAIRKKKVKFRSSSDFWIGNGLKKDREISNKNLAAPISKGVC